MAEAKEIVQHVVLAKLKEEVTPAMADDLINAFAAQVPLIESMKGFHWGKDVSRVKLNEGFTHVFVATFESTEGIAEYFAHTSHIEFKDKYLKYIERALVIDYKPTMVNL